MGFPLHLHSVCLGDLEWDPDCELRFARGIPGFEAETRMIPIEIPAQRPLVYLQSTANPEVCFLALPASSIRQDFAPRFSLDDYIALGLEPLEDPCPGGDLLCLALLYPTGSGLQTNLAAPVVISLRNLRGHQLTPATGPDYWLLSAAGTWEAQCS